MRANIRIFPSAAGLLGCLTPLDLRTGIPSRGKFTRESEIHTNKKLVGLDAYKLAVLISVGATILSLCF